MSENRTEPPESRRSSRLPERVGGNPGVAGPDPAEGFCALDFTRLGPAEMRARGDAFLLEMARRRSVRSFASDPVPRELIELAIAAASTAPSGAHQQPWTFVAISRPDLKRRIREAAEAEEYRSYEGGRMSAEWRQALAPLGTGWEKPYLEIAPWLVVLFEQVHGVQADGSPRKHYYVKESVGMAAGLFIVALHRMGLATLTHTPSPMGFLGRILGRPGHERPFVLFPVGYPADDAVVPTLQRKSLAQVAIFDPEVSEADHGAGGTSVDPGVPPSLESGS